jgi:hypothetical protein
LSALSGDEPGAMLADIRGWFTECFDTADLKDAKTLLDELSGQRLGLIGAVLPRPSATVTSPCAAGRGWVTGHSDTKRRQGCYRYAIYVDRRSGVLEQLSQRP